MATVKRFYLYAVSSISLLVLAGGLYNLASFILAEASDAVGVGLLDAGDDPGRQQLSLAIALIAFGLPFFASHWWLIARGRRGMDPSSEGDRKSAIRAFHMGLISTVALAFILFAGVRLLNATLVTLLGLEDFFDARELTDPVSILVIAVPIWWFHASGRYRDIRHDRMTGAAAWLTRFHRYGWAFAGLLLVLFGTSAVLETVASVLIGRSDLGAEDDWWLYTLAWSISAIAVGLTVFWVHANDARLTIRDSLVIGEDDRTTRLRPTYFGLVLLVVLADGAVAIAASLAELLRWAAGIGEITDVPSFAELVIGPLLVALPFLVAGWLHWAALRRETAGRSREALVAARRLSLHLVALVGLAFMSAGAGQILGRLLDLAVGYGFVDDSFVSELLWLVALPVIGALLWLPAWTAVLRGRGSDPIIERGANSGRAYLFLVVGASLVALVPGGVFTIYRLLDTFLGGSGIGLGSDLAYPLSAAAVAASVGAYHARLLVSDLRVAAPGLATAVPSAVEPPLEAATTIQPPPLNQAFLDLTLRGPEGADLDAVVRSLREGLPAGIALEGR